MSKNEKPLNDIEKLGRYRKLIDTLEGHTNNFDDFCDCGADHNHADDCMTMNWRKDVERCEHD